MVSPNKVVSLKEKLELIALIEDGVSTRKADTQESSCYTVPVCPFHLSINSTTPHRLTL